eukprot:TRINITY_DN5318_c0_g2_i1.p1 TRINITY_DN5318_c0_g2~~TRINITY_DN5318_c0_g2_i1.p1  ORF type:complete len:1107 (+),score=298.47 TRINITY_DN5318_c0_g2_i1:102-3422(+)
MAEPETLDSDATSSSNSVSTCVLSEIAKLSSPRGEKILCVSHFHSETPSDRRWLSYGGENGLLFVVSTVFVPGKNYNESASPNCGLGVSFQQQLKGHQSDIKKISWSPSGSLASCDESGFVALWRYDEKSASFYQHMQNNRNENNVTDIAWSASSLAVSYADGTIATFSERGDLVWSKRLQFISNSFPFAIEWTKQHLLMSSSKGDVIVYDQRGDYQGKLPSIVCGDVKTMACYKGKYSALCTSPTLATGLENGTVLIYESINDEAPILIETNLTDISIKWNDEGTVLAVIGTEENKSNNVRKLMLFSNLGKLLHCSSLPSVVELRSVSFEAGGFQVALAADNFLLFCMVRANPRYSHSKWVSMDEPATLVYSHLTEFNANKVDAHNVRFWSLETKEVHSKCVERLVNMKAFRNLCIIASQRKNNQYLLELVSPKCNVLARCTVKLKPQLIEISSDYAVIASKEMICLWQFSAGETESDQSDEATTWYSSGLGDLQYILLDTSGDDISAIAASKKFFIVARVSGKLHIFNVATGAQEKKYRLKAAAYSMQINCDSTRMSVLELDGKISIYDLDPEGKQLVRRTFPFDRNAVWDLKWSQSDPNVFACMERHHMHIFKADKWDHEEILSSGYIAAIDGNKVRTVKPQELLRGSPERPSLEDDVITDFARNPLRIVSTLDPNSKGENINRTLAHQLAANGFFRELKELISGADGDHVLSRVINCRDQFGRTPMMVACSAGSFDCALILLDSGADIECKDTNGMTALHYASYNGRENCVSLLLHFEKIYRKTSSSDYVNERTDKEKLSALHFASISGHQRVVGLLLDCGADVIVRASDGKTPLHYACMHPNDRNADTVILLLEKGAKVNAKDITKRTPLHEAAYHGNKKIASALLQHGAKFDSRCKEGMTPLHFSVYTTDTACTTLLLERGAKVDAKDALGFTPIQHAASQNNIQCLLVLVEQEQKEKELMRVSLSDTTKKLGEMEQTQSVKMSKLQSQIEEKSEMVRALEISALRLQGAPVAVQNLTFDELCDLEAQQEEGLRRIREAKIEKAIAVNHHLLCCSCTKNNFSLVFNCGHKYCRECGEEVQTCGACNSGVLITAKIPVIFS